MTFKCVLTNGRRTSFIEFEEANVGAVYSIRRTWRQLSFPKSRLIETGQGGWELGTPESTVVNARFKVYRGDPPLLMMDQSGRTMLRFARQPEPGRADAVVGEVLYPDGSHEPVTLTPSPMQTRPEKWWFGIGAKVGGTLGVAGAEAMVAVLFNYSLGAVTPILVESSRSGIGLGGSGGVVLVGAYGFAAPQDFVGNEVGGLDFSLSLGERWSSWLRSAKIADPHMLSAIKAAMAYIPTSCRNVSSMEGLMQLGSRFAQSDGAIGWAKNIVGLSAYADHERAFATLDVPVAQKGVEIGLYNCTGKITAVGVHGVGGYQLKWSAPEPDPKPMREPHYGGGNRSSF